ncbi:MAG: RNA methyltransferase [Planctomycetes bacterium]|nr:RNA methyltransferase [Planctomycetota bacterium]
MREKPTVVCGLHAALAVLKHRPGAIRRVYHAASRRHELGALLKHTAALRRPYNEVEPDELEAVAGTVHHEGVVVVTDPLEYVPLPALLRALPRDGVLLALDGVGNPHNLGAILRSAAWFGAAGVVLPLDDPRQAALSPAAVRVARGGAEVVPVAGVPALLPALRQLAAAGVTLVAAEAETGASPLAGPLPPRPCCLVLGAEDQGLTPAARVACSHRLSIPGTGAVESLNVSVAAGILLAGLTRDGVVAPPARSVLVAGGAGDDPSPPRRDKPRPGRRAPGRRGRPGRGRPE